MKEEGLSSRRVLDTELVIGCGVERAALAVESIGSWDPIASWSSKNLLHELILVHFFLSHAH